MIILIALNTGDITNSDIMYYDLYNDFTCNDLLMLV